MSDDAVVLAFLERLAQDHRHGAVLHLAAYQSMYPGFEDAIADAYAGAMAGTSSVSEPPQTTATSLNRQDVDRIGRYRLIRELGRGGQGVVHLAEDTRFGRRVALKVLPGHFPAARNRLARFRREAAMAARLDHPGICPVFDADVENGMAYIAMRYVDGEPLSARIASCGDAGGGGFCVMLDAPDAAEPEDPAGPKTLEAQDRTAVLSLVRLFEKAARALHAMHEAGVIHRDLKPGNIMVTPEGEPVLMDFGLAREEESDLPSLTQTGDVLGTPRYMAPEQVAGRPTHLDARADVWSLGVSLYESLTLRPPFDAPTREGLYQAILAKDPPDPRALNPAIPGDLAVVLATALEKDRDRRYQTALDLAEELRRVRGHEPIVARPVTRWTRLVRWTQRNPYLAVTLAAGVVLLVAGSGISTFFAVEASSTLTEWTRLADGRRLADLLEEADDGLWPAVPSKIPGMERWLDEARALLGRLPEHEAALAALRAQAKPYDAGGRNEDREWYAEEYGRLEVIALELEQLREHATKLEEQRSEARAALDAVLEAEPGSGDRRRDRRLRRAGQRLEQITTQLEELVERREVLRAEQTALQEHVAERRTWTFADDQLEFRHECLEELVAGLRRLDGESSPEWVAIAGMEERLALARRLRDRIEGEDRQAWERLIADVGRPKGPYHGMRMEPIPGLVPLGRDRESELWELWHVASGARPEWEDRPLGLGEVVLGPSSGEEGMVLVLIPAGSFWMGAQADDPSAQNHDPDAEPNESPPHEVELEAYLISKYEVTQGQWKRLWGENPSTYHAGGTWGTSEVTLRNPVTNGSWEECRKACRRWDLALPTEVQWERACRAGTETAYYTGDTVALLEGHANIADEGAAHHYPAGWKYEKGFRDGHSVHAPVGVLSANNFGLHDTHGNVWEWCRDVYWSYDKWQPEGSNGLRGPLHGARSRVVRGGGFSSTARHCRSAVRVRDDRDGAANGLGCRPARSTR